MEEQKKNSLLFATNYSKLPLVGVLFLTFRDLPQFVRKFVNGTKTLDYGCGPGKSTTFLKSLGLDVDGVDICQHMIRFAKEVDCNGSYQVIESAKVPSEDEAYDFVYAGLVLPFTSTKDELLGIVKEIARVLKPGGTFIAVMPNEKTYKYDWMDLNTNFEENRNLVSGAVVKADFKAPHVYTSYHYFWTREDYCDVMSKSKLEVVDIHELLGKETDNRPWISEYELAILTMYIAKKHK